MGLDKISLKFKFFRPKYFQNIKCCIVQDSLSWHVQLIDSSTMWCNKDGHTNNIEGTSLNITRDKARYACICYSQNTNFEWIKFRRRLDRLFTYGGTENQNGYETAYSDQ